MLRQRLLSGFFIWFLLLALLYYAPLAALWLVLAAISCIGQVEFYAMMNKAGIPVFRVIGLACGAALLSVTFVSIGPTTQDLACSYKWEQMVMLVAVIATFVRQFPQKYNEKPLETIACTLFGILYVPYLFNFITGLALAWEKPVMSEPIGETGRLLLIYLVVVVKSTDVGAYFIGRFFGRHNLFPRISPSKTWEGLIGGIIFAILASAIFTVIVHGKMGSISISTMDVVVLGILLSIVGAVGDMFESLVKRASGMKDSSNLVPGMGGMLDVIDSLLFGAPVLYVYARVFMS